MHYKIIHYIAIYGACLRLKVGQADVAEGELRRHLLVLAHPKAPQRVHATETPARTGSGLPCGASPRGEAGTGSAPQLPNQASLRARAAGSLRWQPAPPALTRARCLVGQRQRQAALGVQLRVRARSHGHRLRKALRTRSGRML